MSIVGARADTKARLGRVNPLVIDAILAVALMIFALRGVASQSSHGLTPLAVLCCIAAGSSVAWRRRTPVMAVLVAVAALAAYTLFQDANSNAQMFQAMALDFYMLGRRADDGHRAAVFVVCLFCACSQRCRLAPSERAAKVLPTSPKHG